MVNILVCGRTICIRGYSSIKYLKLIQGLKSACGVPACRVPFYVDGLQRGKPIWDCQEERDHWEGKEVQLGQMGVWENGRMGVTGAFKILALPLAEKFCWICHSFQMPPKSDHWSQKVIT